jgi:hypothetical protein
MVSFIPPFISDSLCCVGILPCVLIALSSICLSACLSACLRASCRFPCLPGSPITTRKLTACLCVCAEKVRHLYAVRYSRHRRSSRWQWRHQRLGILIWRNKKKALVDCLMPVLHSVVPSQRIALGGHALAGRIHSLASDNSRRRRNTLISSCGCTLIVRALVFLQGNILANLIVFCQYL